MIYLALTAIGFYSLCYLVTLRRYRQKGFFLYENPQLERIFWPFTLASEIQDEISFGIKNFRWRVRQRQRRRHKERRSNKTFWRIRRKK